MWPQPFLTLVWFPWDFVWTRLVTKKGNKKQKKKLKTKKVQSKSAELHAPNKLQRKNTTGFGLVSSEKVLVARWDMVIALWAMTNWENCDVRRWHPTEMVCCDFPLLASFVLNCNNALDNSAVELLTLYCPGILKKNKTNKHCKHCKHCWCWYISSSATVVWEEKALYWRMVPLKSGGL